MRFSLLLLMLLLRSFLVLVGLVTVVSSVPNEEQSCSAENGVTLNQDVDFSKPLPAEFAIMYYVVDYGEAQEIAGDEATETRKRIWEMEQYMKNHVLYNETMGEAASTCILHSKLCAFWATLGECENNPTFMTTNCAPVCYQCDFFAPHLRCPFDKKTAELDNIWKPGDLNGMFERIVTDPELQDYGPRVLRQPEAPSSNVDNVVGGPWIVVLDTFLTDEECDALIELGDNQVYETGVDSGGNEAEDTNIGAKYDGRLSSYSWCHGECAEQPIARRIAAKIATLTRIPEENAENLQFLRYESGQFYPTHHDYSEHEVNRSQGPRILTVFLYLNDVEAGGGTNFPELDVTSMPKRGRAAIWPSVMDSDPNVVDERTVHQALPVVSGQKLAINAWLHLRDHKTPSKNNCL